ncbi:hypothetical protein [Halorhabdus sp. BNX81]|uniref:hypothetical protein n=1 Tax=Halorhabdus sp. BNX81 TaxID=2980181 RepID=UPI0023DD2470|nr:hypothetical protein [Halorhabdus sp. BNX81]WEL22564.1 hypothetical protein HBNXHr_2521 [Halorhabdus sp. BNX81]
MAANNDKVQFRGETEKAASKVVDQIRLGGINVSELAREGLKEKLRETLSDEEKIEIHRRYEQGEISEEVAEVLIGDGIAEIEREAAAFEDAMELDTSGVYQE